MIRARVRNHLELKRQRDMLRSLSFRDGLTGLANRRQLDQFLDQEWRRSQRSQSPLSLILMDIDYFKHFNDALGHLAGDDCLRRIAQTLETSIHRAGDLIARYGGEEFVCVLPETSTSGALAVAEKIQALMAELALSHPASTISPCVTLSLGVATRTASQSESVEDLLRAADQALYRAKAIGRNRIVIHDDSLETVTQPI